MPRIKKVDKALCDTPSCDEPAACAGLCTACYQWSYYHKSQGVAATQRYKKRVRRATARVEYHMAERKPASKTVSRSKHGEQRAYLN